MTSSYPTLHLEGGLIAPDLIEEINQGIPFRPESFRLWF